MADLFEPTGTREPERDDLRRRRRTLRERLEHPIGGEPTTPDTGDVDPGELHDDVDEALDRYGEGSA
jgi:hypothetical protein